MPRKLSADRRASPDCSPSSARLVELGEIRVSEIISALSVALDITQGQPEGHAMRTALVGMRLAEEIGLDPQDRAALYYALLLKDIGCSSNAAKVAYLFGADEHGVKRAAKTIDWTRAGQKIAYVWRQCAPGGSTIDKLLRLAAVAKSGPAGERQIVEIRCERGAAIAGQLDFPTATSEAIRGLDELWNGKGHPYGLRREEISLPARICSLAQTVEIYFTTYDLPAALEVAVERRGRWFDPELVDALCSFAGEATFWSRLKSGNLRREVARCEPADACRRADEEYLDRVAEAFAGVVDAKSPWTYRHSTRVADVAVAMAGQFGAARELKRDIRRAGLLHDIGKLGVSSLILDKPGKLTDAEWVELRAHPDLSQRIIQEVSSLRTLADVASAHHERLDGNGYHRRLDGSELSWVARLLAVADIYEALSAHRPYRDGMPWEKIEGILSAETGTGVDPECVAALTNCHEPFTLTTRVESQLEQVDRLMSEVAKT